MLNHIRDPSFDPQFPPIVYIFEYLQEIYAYNYYIKEEQTSFSGNFEASSELFT
jgi:hypothetical protein